MLILASSKNNFNKICFVRNSPVVLCCLHLWIPRSLPGSPVVLSYLKLFERERVPEREKERAPSLQFGEIYEWTKPKSLKVYTEAGFGGRDLRVAVWVIIQSSSSHISHFESHRLWEGTDLSYTKVAHVQPPKKQRKTKKNTHKLTHQMLVSFEGGVTPTCEPRNTSSAVKYELRI